MRLRCNACNGEYEDVLPDGMQYFHACPPLSVVELKDAIAAKRLRLPAVYQGLLDAAQTFDRNNPPAADQIPRVDQVLATFIVKRPRARDENIAPPPDRDTAAQPIAGGAGVTVVRAERLPPLPELTDGV